MKPFAKRVKGAFTLLEMLLAIAITGVLLGAASYLLVSLSTIWTLRTDDAAFDEHADGVSVFLQKAFDESYGRYQPKWTSSSSASGESSGKENPGDSADTDTSRKDASGNTVESTVWSNAGVTFQKILDDDLIRTPSLHFRFFQFPPALGETNPPTTLGVEAWLIFDQSRGLALVWKDIWSIQENYATDDRDLLRTSLLSSFVTRLDYIYWNTERKQWLEYNEPQEESGSYTVPDFIRLTFDDHGRSMSRLIHIPKAERNMPLF
jgi:prepilin-type N-terminal cleavage/methylation domain-containing protein